MKLLVTARDPASANDIAQLLPGLISHGGFIVKMIAQEPAYNILISRDVGSDTFEKGFIENIVDTDHELIEEALEEVFLTFQPDCLLTGISGPGYGIDEISLSICSRYGCSKTFSVQSYWGDLNLSCGVMAETVFVIDEFASKVTAQRGADCKTVITGHLQADRYDGIDIKKGRAAYRSRYGGDIDATIITLFGQPLFEFKWYQETIELFINTVNIATPHVQFIYKPHPKETSESINWVSEKLNVLVMSSSIDRSTDTLTLLASTDLSVSLFSTVGYDLQNLLVRSDIAFSIPMYLFFHEDCIKWFQEYCMLQSIPMAEDGMAIVVRRSEELKSALLGGLTKEEKERCHTAILSQFCSSKSDAITIISRTLLAAV